MNPPKEGFHKLICADSVQAAGRQWRNGGAELDVFDAAQLMGHSQKEHIETYRKWIDPNKIAVSALAAIKRNQAKVKEDLAQTLQKA